MSRRDWGLLLLLAAIMGGGCTWLAMHPPPPPPPPPPPELVATAPDGTKLWRVQAQDSGEWVYFSASGAQWETRRDNGDGAGTVVTRHQTPAGRPR